MDRDWTLAGRQVEDFVVDLVIRCDASPGLVERAMRTLVVPGRAFARAAQGVDVAVTTVLAAVGEAAAVTCAHDALMPQLEEAGARPRSAAVVASSLGTLYALVDPTLPDEEYERLDLVDLVERHLWNRPAWDYDAYLTAERHRLAATA